MTSKNNKLAVDIAILSIVGQELGVLLVKRKDDPAKGKWALPGGFIKEKETADQAIDRVLGERLNLSDIYIKHLDWFDNSERDSRGVTSLAYIGIVDYNYVHTKAGQGILEAEWFPLSQLPKEIAFDHDDIIKSAKNRIESGIRWTDIGFHLMSPEFTIPEMKKVFEKVINREINLSNFRTKILNNLGILNETGKTFKTGGKGKPAPIYTLNLDKVKNLPPNVTIFN